MPLKINVKVGGMQRKMLSSMTSWIGIAVIRRPLFYMCYTVSKVRTKSSLSAWKQQLDPGWSCESNKKKTDVSFNIAVWEIIGKNEDIQDVSGHIQVQSKKYYSTSGLSFIANILPTCILLRFRRAAAVTVDWHKQRSSATQRAIHDFWN